jgi:hypothetical protein
VTNDSCDFVRNSRNSKVRIDIAFSSATLISLFLDVVIVVSHSDYIIYVMPIS